MKTIVLKKPLKINQNRIKKINKKKINKKKINKKLNKNLNKKKEPENSPYEGFFSILWKN